jgi:DNA-binding MarR family transcriptional regulator
MGAVMTMENNESVRMAELISVLRRLCDLKDHHLIKRRTITNAERDCLLQFSDTETMGMKELGRLLDITPAGVTRVVRSLEDKGLVTREMDARDRRGVNAVLTAQGARIARDLRAVSDDLYRSIMHRIEPDARKSVVLALERLVQALDEWLHSQDSIDSELTDSILDHYGIGHWDIQQMNSPRRPRSNGDS